jgi:hypothetical protein
MFSLTEGKIMIVIFLEVNADMAKNQKKNSTKVSSNLQAKANANGYSVLSPEFHNMDEVLAAASYQDAGIQTENIGTDTEVDSWEIKKGTAKNYTKGGLLHE